MDNILNRMNSFLASHTITGPLKHDQCRNIGLTRQIAEKANELWPSSVKLNYFHEDLVEYDRQIRWMFDRLQELYKYKTLITKAQQHKPIDEDCLNFLYELHEEYPISRNIDNFFEMMMDSFPEEYDGYDSDHHVNGTRDDDCDEYEYDDYATKKTKKNAQPNVYQLCLSDIKKRECELKEVNILKKDKDNYCLYTICAVLNQKTSNDWGIMSQIIGFL